MFAWRSNDGDHGLEQLLRAATLFIWDTRQSRARVEVLARSRVIPFTSEVSPLKAGFEGSKTNARSLLRPSPLISPATSGAK